MINHADRIIATSLNKTRKEKEASGWKYKRTFDRDEIFVVRWRVSFGDWSCHVVFIWKQNYCIAGVVENRLFPRPFLSHVRCNLPNCRDSRFTKKPWQIFEPSRYCTFVALSSASAVNFTPLVPFSQVLSRLNKTIEEMGKRRIKNFWCFVFSHLRDSFYFRCW